MKNKIKNIKFPDIESNTKEIKSNRASKNQFTSSSPRSNPFHNIKSFEHLPKLRPISPTYSKIPKSQRQFTLPATAPSRMVSLKITSSNSKASLHPIIRSVETPNFLNSG